MADARDYLKRVKRINKQLRNTRAEKIQKTTELYDIAYSITAQMGGERVQTSGNPQRMADAIAKAVDKGDYYDRRIEELEAEKAEIRSTIEMLTTNEYEVLHLRYFQYKQYCEIGSECGKSESWAKSVHGNALQNVQKILDERERVPENV